MINTFYITTKGRDYIAQSMTDKALVFTRGEFGKGMPAADVSPIILNSLVSPLGPLNILKKEATESTTIITTEFSNRINGAILPAFRLTEIGLYGKLQTLSGQDASEEALILYGYVTSAQADYIDAVQTEYVLNWPLVISDTANVSIEYVDTQKVDMGTFNEAMANIETVSFSGYKAVPGNSYRGIASDNGIDFGKVNGKSHQEATNGHQLFDQSRIPSHSANGATLTNHGDGSFTISGSGALTGSFSAEYRLNHDETINLIHAGTLNLNSVISRPYFSVRLANSSTGVTYADLTHNTKSCEVTQEILDDENTILILQFYAAEGETVIQGTTKPMLWQEGDGTYEAFTGGVAGPNPDYPLEIQSFGENTNIQSGTGQLIDHEKLPTASNSGATVTNNGDGSFTIVGNGTPTGATIVSYTVKDKSLFRAGKLRLLCGAMTNPYCNVFISSSGGSVQLTNLFGSAETKELTEEILNGDNFYMTVAFSSSSDSFINGTIKPILYQDGNDEMRPFGHDTTPVNVPLRSLPNGVCDTYENGKITRNVGVTNIDGTSDIALYSAGGYFYLKKTATEMNMKTNSKLLSSHFHTGKEDGHILSGTNQCLKFVTSKFSTADEFKTWLSSNPVTVYYELATPVIEEATLPTIPSWYDWTNVWHDGPETDITWHINLAGGGVTKEEMELAIQTAIGDAIAGSY